MIAKAPAVPTSSPPNEAVVAVGAKPLPWDRPLCAGEVAFPAEGSADAKPDRHDDGAWEVLRQQFPELAKQARVDGATVLSVLIVGAYTTAAWNTHPLRAAVAAGIAAVLGFVVVRRELAWRWFLSTMLFTARPAIRRLFPSRQPVVQRVEFRERHLIIRYPQGVVGVRWEDVIALSLGFHRGDVVVRISMVGMRSDFSDVSIRPESFSPVAKAMFRRNWRTDQAELLIDTRPLRVTPGEFMAQASLRGDAARRWYAEWW